MRPINDIVGCFGSRNRRGLVDADFLFIYFWCVFICLFLFLLQL